MQCTTFLGHSSKVLQLCGLNNSNVLSCTLPFFMYYIHFYFSWTDKQTKEIKGLRKKMSLSTHPSLTLIEEFWPYQRLIALHSVCHCFFWNLTTPKIFGTSLAVNLFQQSTVYSLPLQRKLHFNAGGLIQMYCSNAVSSTDWLCRTDPKANGTT